MEHSLEFTSCLYMSGFYNIKSKTKKAVFNQKGCVGFNQKFHVYSPYNNVS